MRKAKIASSYIFDEKKIAKSFFEFSNEKDEELGRSPRSGIIANWEQKYYPILELVAKYIVQELRVEPSEAETLLYKYVAYAGYIVAKNKVSAKTKNFVFVKEFDEQEKEIVTIDFLRSKVKDSESPYAMHFNLGKNPVMVEEEKNNPLYYSLPEKAMNKFDNGIPFFMDGTDIVRFVQNGMNKKRNDMIIAEANNSTSWKYFSFELEDNEENVASFASNLSKTGRTVSLQLIPFILEEILRNWRDYSKNNGKQIKFSGNINLQDIGYYKAMLYTNHLSFQDVEFLVDDSRICWPAIKPFTFTICDSGILYGERCTYTVDASGITRRE